MKRVSLFVLIIGLTLQLTAQKAEVNWLSFDELQENYRSNPKPMLLFLYTDWCKYCKIQQNTTFKNKDCLLYTSPSPRDKRQSRMPSSA